jgi:F-type H+-transporting ATPase subunit b
MSELIYQLGIDWKLLLTQGVNFLILLVALTFFVYKPLVKLMKERNCRIEAGLKGAEEAENRLKEIEKIKSEKLAEADKAAVKVIGEAEKKGQKRMREIMAEAEIKAGQTMEEAALIAERKKQEELDRLAKNASALIKAAIVKTVELSPDKIDDNLIAKAAEIIKEKSI